MSNWYAQKYPPFCESEIFSFEYTNFVTAFVIQAIALWALFSNPISNINIMYILVSIFLNGIASAGFHATLEQGWGILDTVTMILPTYFGIVEIIHILLLFKLSPPRDSVPGPSPPIHLPVLRQVLDVASISVCLVFMYFTIALMQVQTSFDFTTLFALPQFVIVVLLILQSILVLRMLGECKVLLIHLWTGVGVILFGAAWWLSTEPYCYYGGPSWLPYTFSHAVWHVTSSYGYYKIVITQIYLRAYLLNHNVTLSSITKPRFLSYLFPRIVIPDGPEVVSLNQQGDVQV